MGAAVPYALVYAGSAVMIYNIYRYLLFARVLRTEENWDKGEQRLFSIPVVLLMLFLLGYLTVGFVGRPDLVVAFILFGGSIFVLTMILFVQQITWRIKEHEHLKSQLMAAEEGSRAKSAFLSVMSHEMRTPMNAIIGLVDLTFREPGLTSSVEHRLRQMRMSAEHLLELINDVLDMSRIEAGEMTLNNEPFSLPRLLERVNGMIEGQCAAKGLTFEHAMLGCQDEFFVADCMKIRQVLINILGNAVKFTNVPGTVTHTVEVLDQGDRGRRTICFTVSDTGIGIDAAYLPRLFTPFSQEDASITTTYGGSGLGMAISKSIVDLLGGDISVESEKDRGTTFVVTVALPLYDGDKPPIDNPCSRNATATRPQAPDVPEATDAPDNEAHSPESSQAEAYEALAGAHVLIAEDVDINAEILMGILEIVNVSCTRATNGRESVELFEMSADDPFDAILMDMRMPVMDGLEAARRIREGSNPRGATIPIVALTANVSEEDVQRCLEAGMDAHLPKPIDPNQLFATLTSLFERTGNAQAS